MFMKLQRVTKVTGSKVFETALTLCIVNFRVIKYLLV